MEKQKIMLIAGCSHAAGSEIDGTPDSAYNRNHCFGSLLSYKAGYVPVNLAIAGNSNSGIARTILKWFEANYDPESMEVVVLIAWTDSTRMEIPVDRDVYLPECEHVNWLDITAKRFYRLTLGWEGDPWTPGEVEMTKKCHKFIVENEKFMEVLSLNYVLQMEYFLKSKNVKYVMCNSMPMYDKMDDHLGFYLSLVDHTKYYGIHNASEAFYIKYKQLGYTNEKAKYWHHNEEPHSIFAEELYNYIQENKCF
jgi:hypothetical protein